MAPAGPAAPPSTRPPRKAATQAASQRHHGEIGHPPAARAGEGVHGGHEHGQEQRAGEQGQGPARHHLAHGQHVALGAVLGAAALVHRRERAQGRPAQGAQAILVIRPGRPSRAGARRSRRSSPRRSPARASPPGRPMPDREGQAGQAARTRRWIRASGRAPRGSSRPPCAGGRSPRGGCRSTRPGGTSRGGWASRGPDTATTASTRDGGPEIIGQPRRAHLAEGGAVERGQHQRLARRAALEHTRQLEESRGVGGAAREIGRPGCVAVGQNHHQPPRAARTPGHHVLEARARRRVNRSRSTVNPRARQVARHRAGGGAVARPARARGPGSLPRCRRPAPRPGGRRRARRRPAPAAAGGDDPRARTSSARPPTGQARTPPCRRAARSRRRNHHRRNLQSRR